MEEKCITIKFNSNADEFIKQLQEIKKLLVEIKEIEHPEWKSECSDYKRHLCMNKNAMTTITTN